MPNFKKNKNAYMMKPKGMGQQAYKMNGSDPKKKKPIVSKTSQGEIKQASSKATQLFRKIKNTPAGSPGAIGFGKKIAQFGAVLAPVPALGKVKAVKKIGTAFSNASKQYRSKAGVGGSNIVIGNTISAAKQAKAVFKPKAQLATATIKMPKRNFISAVKQGISAGKKLFKGFSNAPKQYMKEYKVGGKLYGHYTKSGKLTNKYVPVVGKPGKTVKVPKKSKTKQVSYANPRISMTAEQRRKAGY